MFYIFGKLQHQGKLWQKLGAILMDRFGDLTFWLRVDQTSDFDLRVCLNLNSSTASYGSSLNKIAYSVKDPWPPHPWCFLYLRETHKCCPNLLSIFQKIFLKVNNSTLKSPSKYQIIKWWGKGQKLIKHTIPNFFIYYILYFLKY